MVLPMSRSRRRIASPGRRATLQADLFPDNESYVRAVHDQGLAFDLDTLAHGLGRRRMLMVLGGGRSVSRPALPLRRRRPPPASRPRPPRARRAVGEISEETAGPYPGDGSNGPDVLAEDGIVRQDITSSFGSSTTTAEGVPLTIELTLVDVGAGGTPLVTSQVALPEAACEEVFATDGYSTSVRNLSRVSLTTDVVFSDDEGESQLARMSGSVSAGCTAALTVGV